MVVYRQQLLLGYIKGCEDPIHGLTTLIQDCVDQLYIERKIDLMSHADDVIQENPERYNSGYPQLDNDFRVLQNEQLELFAKKQKDYGPGNINAFGEFGILVRMNDKMERLKNLIAKSGASYAVLGYKTLYVAPTNEAIDDTYRDIATYALIALLVRREQWPKS